VSVQLQALADEVFDAAAALDLVVPSEMGPVAALAAGFAEEGHRSQTRVAMVQVFISSPGHGGGSRWGLSLVPVQDEKGWSAFEGLIRAAGAVQSRTDDMAADLIALYRWRAANSPHRFYLACDGDRAVAHVGLFQHRSNGYLHALFTRPDCRRRGAGSFLTLAMDSEARAVGCERVALDCARDSRLPAYFARLGFRAVGERQV
jgi:N-acetylglutamate synthase-like GNAT family acetyltransferase